MIAHDGSELAFSQDLAPPAEHRDSESVRAGATGFSWSVPTIATVGADRVSVGPLWMNGDPENPDQQMVTQTFGQAGQLLGTLPRDLASGWSVDLLPTDLDTGPTSPLGTVVFAADGSRWITLTPDLEPVDETEIVAGAGYRRVGGHLIVWPFGGKDADQVVHLYAITPDGLHAPVRLDPADLPGAPEQINSITGDDTHLAIRFEQTVAVLPQ